MKKLAMLIGGIGLACAAWGQGTVPLTVPATNAIPAAGPAVNAQEQFGLGVRFIQERRYSGAAECFQRALQAQPVYPDAYNNWGIALVQMGKQAQAVEQQIQLYQQAADKFSKAAAQDPNNRITQLLWSEVLVLIGDMPVDGRVRLGCYQGAVEKCRRAAELGPTDWETYNKWGAILSTKLPDFAVDDKARLQLYMESAKLFAKAAANARFSSEIGSLHANWGSALVRAARLATDSNEKCKLLGEAIEKFDRSAHAVPGAALTYTMWGNALVERGKCTRLRGDFRDGIDRLNTAISLNPSDGASYYGLARAYVVIENTVMAIQTLKKMKQVDKTGTLLRDAALDPDFIDLRNDPDFQELVDPAGIHGGSSYNPSSRELLH